MEEKCTYALKHKAAFCFEYCLLFGKLLNCELVENGNVEKL